MDFLLVDGKENHHNNLRITNTDVEHVFLILVYKTQAKHFLCIIRTDFLNL